MEVDVPQVNGFTHNQTKVAKKSVHFGSPVTRSAAAEVMIVSSKPYKTPADAKPKHKARRRARHPSKSDDTDNGTAGPKPLSPIKIQKMAAHDRHSRSGVRGLPKKGISQVPLLLIWLLHMGWTLQLIAFFPNVAWFVRRKEGVDRLV